MELFNTYISEKSKQLVQKVLDSTYLNQGPMVDELEKRLAEEMHMSNPVTLNSCTSSLFLALKLAGVVPGDRVIIPPQTFIATGLAVLMLDATPVFCDVDINGNLSVVDLKEKIVGAKAVIVVHWGGIPANLRKISQICQPLNVKVIEDAAHAIGANYKNSSIGDCKYSDFCCFSLQSIKSLTAGDGGILCCKNRDDYNRAIKMRWFGMDKKSVVRSSTGERVNEVYELGYKFHMNDLSSAVALGNLDSLKTRINVSRGWANIYYERLKGYPIGQPVIENRCDPSYWFYSIRVQNRDAFLSKLRETGIPASTVDRRIDTQPIFAPYRQITELIGQQHYDEQHIALPCHSQLTSDDVIQVVDSVKRVCDDFKS